MLREKRATPPSDSRPDHPSTFRYPPPLAVPRSVWITRCCSATHPRARRPERPLSCPASNPMPIAPNTPANPPAQATISLSPAMPARQAPHHEASPQMSPETNSLDPHAPRRMFLSASQHHPSMKQQHVKRHRASHRNRSLYTRSYLINSRAVLS